MADKKKREPWNPLLCNYPDSRKINELSFEAETLYTRLIARCDDGANYDADATLILCQLFAKRKKKRQVSERKITKWLQELTENELVLRYLDQKEHYIHLVNCKKHIRNDIKPDLRFPPYSPENIEIEETEPKVSVTVTGRTRNENVSSTTTTTTTTTTYSQNSNEFRLAKLLFDLISQRDPKFKKRDLQGWATHIDRLIRLDDRSAAEIERVIRWCQQDDFWQDNILSTKKLRKQFSQLWLKMKPSKTTQTQERPRCITHTREYGQEYRTRRDGKKIYLCGQCSSIAEYGKYNWANDKPLQIEDKLKQLKIQFEKQQAERRAKREGQDYGSLLKKVPEKPNQRAVINRTKDDLGL